MPATDLDLKVSISDVNNWTIGAQRVDASGAVQQSIDVPQPAGTQARHPVVASNGDGFLLVYERVNTTRSAWPNSDVGMPKGGTDVSLEVKAFDRNGALVNSSSHAIGTMNADNYRRTSMDVAWMGDRYRLVWKFVNQATIYMADFDGNGWRIGSGAFTQLATDAARESDNTEGDDYTPHLAYDPYSGRWLLVYVKGESKEGYLRLYSSVASTTPYEHRPYATSIDEIDAAFDPVERTWLVSNGQSGQTYISQHPSDMIDNVWASRYLPRDMNVEAGSSLSCPSHGAVPIVELQLEEEPGATTFADTSGSGNNACGPLILGARGGRAGRAGRAGLGIRGPVRWRE